MKHPPRDCSRHCRPHSRPCRPSIAVAGAVAASSVLLAGAVGCESPMDRIDRQTEQLLDETSEQLGPDTLSPREIAREHGPPDRADRQQQLREQPGTVNPAAEALEMEVIEEAEEAIDRLEGYADVDVDPYEMDLFEALRYSTGHSPEFKTAEEEYVLAALRLLMERHRWGPRFFNETSAELAALGDDGLYDTSIRLVNELRATQRLPYGGEVSARALAQATENLHHKVAGQGVQSAEIILDANIPLLRGAGHVAREDRIQAERDLIYAARQFERFRRQFLVSIAQDYLSLVVQQQGIENARRQLETLQEIERAQHSMVEAGRIPPFLAAQASQNTNFARDRLNQQLETFRVTAERFKVRIGMPIDQPLDIDVAVIDLPAPRARLDDAVRAAMAYRLDLQTRRDQLDDVRRALENARNQILGDLHLAGEVRLPTDRDKDRAGLQFQPDSSEMRASITYGLPLDREIERLSLREAQIRLERERRDYEQFRDSVAVDVRAAVRDIDRAMFSLQLQEEDIRIAERRQASIDAAPERADLRDRLDAVDDLLRALDQRDAARRDLQVAILEFLLETGQLRIDQDGMIRPPRGLEHDPDDEPDDDVLRPDALPGGPGGNPDDTRPEGVENASQSVYDSSRESDSADTGLHSREAGVSTPGRTTGVDSGIDHSVDSPDALPDPLNVGTFRDLRSGQ